MLDHIAFFAARLSFFILDKFNRVHRPDSENFKQNGFSNCHEVKKRSSRDFYASASSEFPILESPSVPVLFGRLYLWHNGEQLQHAWNGHFLRFPTQPSSKPLHDAPRTPV